MAITPTGSNAALSATTTTSNPKGTLSKDDFMKLLLTELQHQDPTKPTDTDKILTQTSQLASLESSDNTKTSLDKLTKILGTSQQFSTISAIGKTADLGSDSIALNKGTPSTFEVYFPKDVQQGSIDITDSSGNTVKTLDVGTNPAGVYKFTWDGTDQAGGAVDSGVYHVNSDYTDSNNATQKTKLGIYPIESIKFDKGEALAKVGPNYVPLSKIKEVY